MKVNVDVENVSSYEDIPDQTCFHQWVSASLSNYKNSAEVAIRIINEDESAKLNYQFRKKNYATNILSFPADLPKSLNLSLLGDLAVCVQVVIREAIEQNKEINAHWAHIIVHGSLHLIGYDHEDDLAAKNMEALEIKILGDLNFPSPYINIGDIDNS
jgi:probable rRNA maturation factor